MKNVSANKMIVLAACAASTASSTSKAAAALPTTTVRGAPWIVKHVPRGGSKKGNNEDDSEKFKKSSSSQNRTGKKNKSTKTTREKSKSTNVKGKSDTAKGKKSSSSSSSSNPLLEEILRYDDLYDVLGVSKTASEREIQKAYRKRCVQTHPDKTGGDRLAFDKVAEAYAVLSEPSKRQIYNQYGKAGLDPTNANNGAAFGGSGVAGDMFRSMFQQAQQHRQQQQKRNQNLQYQLEVSLEDLYYGRMQTVTVAPPQNRYQSYHQQRQKRKEVEVHIEKGSISGQSIVMSGEVDFNDDNSPPGDLVFILTQAPHSSFTRKGHDLAMELTISLEEALCGLQRSIKHLDGSEMWIESATRQSDQSSSQKLKSERGKSDIDDNENVDNIISTSIPIMIRTGDVQVLKGRGMPKRNENGEFGDLYIQYRVEMPQSSKGRSAGNVLTKEEYNELSRLLSKLQESNGTRKNDLANRRKNSRNRRNKVGEEQNQDEVSSPSPPKIHSLQEAISSDFGTASGRVSWEEQEEDQGGFHGGSNPFASSFFGQGFGGGQSSSYSSQQFHFGGAGSPFGGGGFGGAGAGEDDGNVQCQQM